MPKIEHSPALADEISSLETLLRVKQNAARVALSDLRTTRVMDDNIEAKRAQIELLAAELQALQFRRCNIKDIYIALTHEVDRIRRNIETIKHRKEIERYQALQAEIAVLTANAPGPPGME